MKIASTALLFSAHVMLGFPVVYVKLPVDAVLFALANLGLIRKDRTEYDRNWTFLKIDSDIVLDIQNRIMKLFEQFGEAIPQLLLTVTYYINNVYYIWWTDHSSNPNYFDLYHIFNGQCPDGTHYRIYSRKRCGLYQSCKNWQF